MPYASQGCRRASPGRFAFVRHSERSEESLSSNGRGFSYAALHRQRNWVGWTEVAPNEFTTGLISHNRWQLLEQYYESRDNRSQREPHHYP